VKDRLKDAFFLFLAFAASTAFCISGDTPPVPFAPEIGGACGLELTCATGYAILWFGVWLVLVAVYWLFPDR
jgi:hypothetical protein